MTYTGITLLNVVNASTIDLKGIRIVSSILAGIAALEVVTNGLGYKFKNDEIKELEKYNIYLQIRTRLENINDPNLFNEIEKQKTYLNINTLDGYSLSDIKKLETT